MGAARLSSLALGGSAVGMAILGLVSSPLGVFAGSIVFAIASHLFPGSTRWRSRGSVSHRGSAVGTASAFFDPGVRSRPAVMGVVAQRAGFGGTFLVSAVIAAGGRRCSWRGAALRNGRRRRSPARLAPMAIERVFVAGAGLWATGSPRSTRKIGAQVVLYEPEPRGRWPVSIGSRGTSTERWRRAG